MPSPATNDKATNANTNTAAASSSFVYDTTAPTGTVIFPASGSHYNAAGCYFFYSDSAHRDLHSFPTRRSSDLKDGGANSCWDGTNAAGHFTSACPNYVTATGTTS